MFMLRLKTAKIACTSEVPVVEHLRQWVVFGT